MDGWFNLCSCDGFGRTQQRTADLWSVAAVNIGAVTSVAAVGLSPGLRVCVWLLVCLFCLSATCHTQWVYLAPMVAAGRADTSPCLVLFLAGEGHILFLLLPNKLPSKVVESVFSKLKNILKFEGELQRSETQNYTELVCCLLSIDFDSEWNVHQKLPSTEILLRLELNTFSFMRKFSIFWNLWQFLTVFYFFKKRIL